MYAFAPRKLTKRSVMDLVAGFSAAAPVGSGCAIGRNVERWTSWSSVTSPFEVFVCCTQT